MIYSPLCLCFLVDFDHMQHIAVNREGHIKGAISQMVDAFGLVLAARTSRILL